MQGLVKRTIPLLALILAFAAKAQDYKPTAENLKARKEFADSKLGIFIHWGLYSLFAQGEWYLNSGINAQEYAKSTAAFYPHNFDAAKWVEAIKESGAKYITFTSRHHDGFSMWDTKQSEYNIMNTPYGRDIVRQLADECHRQGIRLHLYYSHLDWTRDDYPLGRTGLRTGRKNASKKGNWASYYAFMNRQLTELLTNYGKIGAIWFDGWWDHDEDSVPFNWELPKQYALIHSLQPSCLIGNNHHQTPNEGEDIQIFERDVPGENTAGLSGQDIGKLPLETCQTMNGMWGYKIADQNYKTAAQIVRLLVRTSAKGANLLLNIGPQPDGSLPDAALERLKALGKWLGENGGSIYGTTAGEVSLGDSIVSTRKADTLFLHVLKDDITIAAFPYKSKPRSVILYPEGTKLEYTYKKGILSIAIPERKDCWDTIIRIE